MVDYVVSLSAELQVEPLIDLEVLDRREVEGYRARTAAGVTGDPALQEWLRTSCRAIAGAGGAVDRYSLSVGSGASAGCTRCANGGRIWILRVRSRIKPAADAAV